MLTLESLSANDIRSLLGQKNYNKGSEIVHTVKQGERSGNTLQAGVQGHLLYEVMVTVRNDTGIATACTCPAASSGGACKHAAAVLLKWLQAPAFFALSTALRQTIPAGEGTLEVTPASIPATETPKQLPTWLTKTEAETTAAMVETTVRYFSTYRLEDLRALASSRGWAIKGTRKAEIVQKIVEQMQQPAQHLRGLQQLDSEHRHVLWAIAQLGPIVTHGTEALERAATQFGPLGKHKKIETYAAHLAQAGWVVGAGLSAELWGVPWAFLTELQARAYPPLLAETLPGSDELPPGGTAAEIALGSAGVMLKGVHQLLALLEQSPPVVRTPMPRPRAEQFQRFLQVWDYDPAEIAQLLTSNRIRNPYQLSLTVPPPQPLLADADQFRLAPLVGGTAQLDFVLPLLRSAGLLQPGSPLTVWRAVKEQFLRRSEDEQMGILARAYFELTDWSELWLSLQADPALRLFRAASSAVHGAEAALRTFRNTLTAGRNLVLRTLAMLPDDKWFGFTDLCRLLQGVWRQFDDSFVGSSYNVSFTSWHVTYAGRPLTSTNTDDWGRAQGSFIAHLLAGPLCWLGLADVHMQDQRLTHVRLHGLSDLYWGRTRRIAVRAAAADAGQVARPQQQTELTVDGDLIRARPDAISAQLHALLDKIARVEQAQPDLFVYRLDAAIAHRSFEAGYLLEELLAAWQSLRGTPPPASIQSRLTAWWESYGTVRLYKGVTVIEFSDDFALTEMKAATSLNKVLVAELSPRLVMIPKAAVATLIAELEKAGYTPQQQ